MKVTDPDVIKSGERELIESIKDDLDLSAVHSILLKKFKSSLKKIEDGSSSFDVRGGEIVVHGGKIAFRIDFQLKTDMAIMFDRQGNYISVEDDSSPDDLNEEEIFNTLEEDGEEISGIPEEDEFTDALKSDELQDGFKSQDDKAQYNDLVEEFEDDDIADEPGSDDITDRLEPDDADKPSSSDQLLPDDLLLDDLDSFEDEDILGDITDEPVQDDIPEQEDSHEPDPIADLDDLDQSDDIEELLKESRKFWENQDK
ncbi:MAG: hypothetical protein HQK61_08655 [Desulfamplus sp.]|nr:hypothetical protein [Desulfamplus sp.]